MLSSASAVGSEVIWWSLIPLKSSRDWGVLGEKELTVSNQTKLDYSSQTTGARGNLIVTESVAVPTTNKAPGRPQDVKPNEP